MATIRWWKLALWASIVAHGFGLRAAQQPELSPSPKRTTQQPTLRAHRFLVERGLNRASGINLSPAELLQEARAQHEALKASASGGGTTSLSAPWTSVGPSAVETSSYGYITGRVTSLAVDSSDTSGNTVYVGSTGGGVWKSTNAARQAASVSFVPLTDTLPISSGCSTPPLASLSIGALTVQPGGTGVILAGTGDPNDALDSYYGNGILRSTDKGNTWCLISTSKDIYYGSLLATIEDGPTLIIQSSQIAAAGYTGNSATSVTWNPVRKRFYAAVRYHGYYESSDGITWTRLANQPGINSAKCPANPNALASSACPVFRGTITAQPVTGDLFAITVDNTNSDQGLWQDRCNAAGSGCASSTVAFSTQIADAAIDTGGGTNIPQGDYDLSLAAVPSQQDTLLFVGARCLSLQPG